MEALSPWQSPPLVKIPILFTVTRPLILDLILLRMLWQDRRSDCLALFDPFYTALLFFGKLGKLCLGVDYPFAALINMQISRV